MTTQRILVREFSACGPCLTLGEFVRRTPKTIVYREWRGGDRFGDERRVGGWKVQSGGGDHKRAYIHTEPCRSCRDHTETQYPHGYMD